MATKIKDSATATVAALGLNTEKGTVDPVTGEPKAPVERSTGQKLFPEFVTDDGAIINRPVKPYEDTAKVLPATMTPEPNRQPQNPNPAAPTVPNYLKIDEMTGKMVKVKVDGVESDVPAESLIKNFQLERTLNSRLESLAEERRKLDQERASMRTPPPTPQEQPKPTQPPVKKGSELEALEARLAETQAQLANLQQTLTPQIQRSAREIVASVAKEQTGFDDFDSYFDRIADFARAESLKPEVATNPAAKQYLDSKDFYLQKYMQMKMKDMSAGQKPNVPVPGNAPVLQNQSGAPVIVDRNGNPVGMPDIEGSGGVPSRGPANGDWSTKAQEAFNLARSSGQTADWMRYYKIKSEGPA